MKYSFVQLLLGSIFLSGCAAFPQTGPNATSMADINQVNLVDATPAVAAALNAQVSADEQRSVKAALTSLAGPSSSSPVILGPGDKIGITLWSFSPWSNNATTSMSQASGPAPAALGEYQLAADGTVSLPFIGSVSLDGLDLSAAQKKLGDLYVRKGIVQDPSVIIVPKDVPQESILVTGAVGAPKSIPWSPAGVTLATALTQSLGDGSEVLGGNSDFAVSKTALQVEVIRNGATAELPISEAFLNDVPLQPGDKVIIKKSAAVKVVLLGGGVAKDGVQGYGESPTLAQVLANASGLNPDTANGHAVFVMRQITGQSKPTLYDFSWNKVSGLFAAQQFPMLNGDIVYVAEAPIVPVERVVTMLFQLSLPVQAAR